VNNKSLFSFSVGFCFFSAFPAPNKFSNTGLCDIADWTAERASFTAADDDDDDDFFFSLIVRVLLCLFPMSFVREVLSLVLAEEGFIS